MAVRNNVLGFSEAASLAFHTMALLASDVARRWTNRQFAETLGRSVHHLAKVTHRLAKEGLTNSVPGPGGGFRLGRPACEISLLEIYEAIEGPLGEFGCLLDRPVCCGEPCKVSGLMHSIGRQITDFLSKTTLEELVQDSAIRTLVTASAAVDETIATLESNSYPS